MPDHDGGYDEYKEERAGFFDEDELFIDYGNKVAKTVNDFIKELEEYIKKGKNNGWYITWCGIGLVGVFNHVSARYRLKIWCIINILFSKTGVKNDKVKNN